jgi:hypothetical protein
MKKGRKGPGEGGRGRVGDWVRRGEWETGRLNQIDHFSGLIIMLINLPIIFSY